MYYTVTGYSFPKKLLQFSFVFALYDPEFDCICSFKDFLITIHVFPDVMLDYSCSYIDFAFCSPSTFSMFLSPYEKTSSSIASQSVTTWVSLSCFCACLIFRSMSFVV